MIGLLIVESSCGNNKLIYFLLLFGGKLFTEVHLSDIFAQSDFDNEKGCPQANVNNWFAPSSLKCGWPEACDPQQVQDRHSAPGAGGQRGRVHGCRPQGVHLQLGTVGAWPPARGEAPAFCSPAAGNWGLTPVEGSVHIFVSVTVYFSSLFLFFTSRTQIQFFFNKEMILSELLPAILKLIFNRKWHGNKSRRVLMMPAVTLLLQGHNLQW